MEFIQAAMFVLFVLGVITYLFEKWGSAIKAFVIRSFNFVKRIFKGKAKDNAKKEAKAAARKGKLIVKRAKKYAADTGVSFFDAKQIVLRAIAEKEQRLLDEANEKAKAKLIKGL